MNKQLYPKCSYATEAYKPGDPLYGRDLKCPVCGNLVRLGYEHYGNKLKVRIPPYDERLVNSVASERDEQGWVKEQYLNDHELDRLKALARRPKKAELANLYTSNQRVMYRKHIIYCDLYNDGEKVCAIIKDKIYIVEREYDHWRVI